LSYLLINFWHTRYQANKAAIKAIIINRVGDLGISLAIIILFYVFKSTSFLVILPLAHLIEMNPVSFFGFEFLNPATLIGLFLFLGAVGKSAQLGLHTWLPDAMEGPTPVSALIHAATMVTAGVFVLVRCSAILEMSSFVLSVITVVGALTAFFAATSGMFQNDLKRVIAYSTCSQLGYMVFTVGLSNYSLSMFHLANHAFFKALLFLSAGSVIHALSDEQDMRRMGGLVKILPVTYIMMLIGSLALAGFPFLTGFYSKDVILELGALSSSVPGKFAYYLGVVSAFFTAYYSFRLIYLTFLSKPNGYKVSYMHAHEPGMFMMVPLLILCFGSLFWGFVMKDSFIGLGSTFWGVSLIPLSLSAAAPLTLESEFIPASIKLIPVAFSFFGIALSLFLYNRMEFFLFRLKGSRLGRTLFSFFSKKWYFDLVYNRYIVDFIFKLSYQGTFKAIDKGLLEYFGPSGLQRFFYKLSYYFHLFQTGYVYSYVFIVVTGVVALLILALYDIDNLFVQLLGLCWVVALIKFTNKI